MVTVLHSTGIKDSDADPTTPKHAAAIEQIVDEANCDHNKSNRERWD